MLQLSTAARNRLLGTESLADIFADGVIKIFTGTPPNSADDAETGTLLVTITRDSKTVATKQKVTFTVLNAVNDTEYSITLNGVEVVYKSSSSATLDEISAGLADLLKKACGTPDANGSYIVNPKVYNEFTITDMSGGTGKITVEANTENKKFYFTAGGNMAIDTDVENYYGLHFSYNPTDGTLSKDPGEIWSGVCVNSGIAGYFRFVTKDDDGSASPNFPRLQGTVGTANADMLVTSTTFSKGATQTVDFATITLPAV